MMKRLVKVCAVVGDFVSRWFLALPCAIIVYAGFLAFFPLIFIYLCVISKGNEDEVIDALRDIYVIGPKEFFKLFMLDHTK